MVAQKRLPTKSEATAATKAFFLELEHLRQKHGICDFVCGAVVLYGKGFRSVGICSDDETTGFPRLAREVTDHLMRRMISLLEDETEQP